MAGKFVLYKGNNGEHYFRLQAGNGEVILRSEGYKDKAGAENGIASIRKHASDPRFFEKKTASNGKFHFNIKAANHQVIGSSQMYASESGRDNGIDSVMRHAADAAVVEE